MSDASRGADSACDHARVSSLLRSLREDLGRYRRGERGVLSAVGLLSTPQMATTVLHRASHCLFARGHVRTARLLASLNLYLFKAAFSPASCVGAGLYLAFPAGLVFEARAGDHLSLYTRCVCFSGAPALTGALRAAPFLGDHVSIGAHGAVIGPVRVGSRVRIGFNVAVRADVPADRVVLSRGMFARSAAEAREEMER